jgi:hypothetical protein
MRRVESFGILVRALGSSALLAQDAKMQFEVASVRAAAPAPKGAPLKPAAWLGEARARAIPNVLRMNACRFNNC